MQWHRHNHVGFGDQCTTRTGQPTSEGGRAMHPVPVFQTGDQIPAHIVVEKHRPRPRKKRVVPDAGPAQCRGA